MAVTIGGERPTLEVIHANGETYHVPLLYSLTPQRVRELGRSLDDPEEGERVLTDFFSEYIPAQVMAELTLGERNALVAEWQRESQEHAGVDLGE